MRRGVIGFLSDKQFKLDDKKYIAFIFGDFRIFDCIGLGERPIPGLPVYFAIITIVGEYGFTILYAEIFWLQINAIAYAKSKPISEINRITVSVFRNIGNAVTTSLASKDLLPLFWGVLCSDRKIYMKRFSKHSSLQPVKLGSAKAPITSIV